LTTEDQANLRLPKWSPFYNSSKWKGIYIVLNNEDVFGNDNDDSSSIATKIAQTTLLCPCNTLDRMLKPFRSNGLTTISIKMTTFRNTWTKYNPATYDKTNNGVAYRRESTPERETLVFPGMHLTSNLPMDVKTFQVQSFTWNCKSGALEVSSLAMMM
jgi:hypothetical protein